MQKIGCVQHDCDECKEREVVSMEPVAVRWHHNTGYEYEPYNPNDTENCELLYSSAQLASVQSELAVLKVAERKANETSNELFSMKQERDELLTAARHFYTYATCGFDKYGQPELCSMDCFDCVSSQQILAKYEVK